MFDSLVELVVTSDWPYALVFAVAALDAIVPLVPSEATLVAAGALAASGRLSLAAVLAAGAAGAFVGDNAGYSIGRLSSRVVARLDRSEKARRRLEWAQAGLARRSGTLIVVSRFIPGGRTATMLAAGVTRFRWACFARLDAVAAVLWSVYGAGLGYVGGTAFGDRPLLGSVVALGLAGGLAILIEALRRVRRRHGRPAAPATDWCNP